jgi:hypothetical protein
LPTLEFAGAALPLSSGDIDAEAALLGCNPAAIRAVCEVEASGRGFLPDKRLKILFEAHSFHTLTGGQYDDRYPNISSPTWDRSLYGASGEHQYTRLQFAIALDREAALKSASWGMFQIMGSNFKAAGFDSVEHMVAAMMESERRHLDAFAAFCRANRITDCLSSEPPDFVGFALAYNGRGEAQNDYHGKLAAAYAKWLANPPAPTAPPVTPPAAPNASNADDLNRQELDRLAKVEAQPAPPSLLDSVVTAIKGLF